MKQIFTVLLILIAMQTRAQQTIEFPSTDGLTITADLYLINEKPTTPFIILFHQAGWSRGEYLEIAPKLNKLGFNCMAVDQRSGGRVNEVINQTAKLAMSKALGTDFHHALPDIEAAVNYVSTNYTKPIIWGSSYSAALVLKYAGDNPAKVKAVMAFSPGEYYKRLGKPDDWIQQSAVNITCPVFITSSRDEEGMWRPIFDVISIEKKYSFIPVTKGNHGSRALWEKYSDSNEYWEAVKKFLESI